MKKLVIAMVSLGLTCAAFGGCSTSTPAKAPDNRSPAQRAADHRQFQEDDKWLKSDGPSELDPSDYESDDGGCQYVVTC